MILDTTINRNSQVDINLYDGNKMTALMWAAKNNNKKALDLLLQLGADEKKQNLEGKTYKDLLKTN